jgi:hypothetical protein
MAKQQQAEQHVIDGVYTLGHPPRMRRAIKRVPLGYDIGQVDDLLSKAEDALAGGGEVRRAKARQDLRSTEINRRLRGYSRPIVHSLFDELSRQLGSSSSRAG